MNFSGNWEGLSDRIKRRKLFQWTAAYLAAAWVVYQAIGLVADTFEWPPVVMRALTVLLGVGFLAALVVAWYHGERGYQRVTPIELFLFAGLAVTAVLGISLVGREAIRSEAPFSGAAEPRRVIAVLPLQNLSTEPGDSVFAGGFHDELITQLYRIPSIGVISRPTMLRYAGSERSIPDIAREVGATAVMTGSLRRFGSRVRINLELVDGVTNQNLWTNRYVREEEIIDIFAVQSDVAQKVTESLRAALTPAQAEGLSRRPTVNEEAYARYLSAMDYLGRNNLEPTLRTAATMLERAVQLDPSFAEAWAGLGSARSDLYWLGFEPTVHALASGHEAAEKAYTLAPNLPAVRYAMAGSFYHDRDYARALELILPILDELPDYAPAVYRASDVYRRQGDWENALRLRERAVALEPAGLIGLEELANTYRALHRFADAERVTNRAVVIAAGEFPSSDFNLANVKLEAAGDVAAARMALGNVRETFSNDRELALAWLDAGEGYYEVALNRLASLPEPGRSNVASSIGNMGSSIGIRSPKALLEGWLLDRLERPAEARSRYLSAVDSLEAVVNADGFDPRGQAPYLSALAWAYAGLGRKELAIETAQRSARELPVSLDALFGPRRLVDLARVYALVGEKDLAVAALSEALSYPVPHTPAALRWDPLLESLQSYPPFLRLLRG